MKATESISKKAVFKAKPIHQIGIAPTWTQCGSWPGKRKWINIFTLAACNKASILSLMGIL